jgi:flagellar hook-associated protein 2
MANISSLGSASGLDLEGLLSKLRESAEKPLSVIKDREKETNARISAYGQVKSIVETVKTAAPTLGDPKTFAAVQSSVTGSGLNVVANAGALPGQYSIVVNTLATAQTLQVGPLSDRTAAIGVGGTITFTMANGNSTVVTVGSDSSLNGIMTAINTSDNVGVRASIINDGNGGNYLIFTAKNTGQQAAVSAITVDGNTTLSSYLAFDSANPTASPLKETTAAVNASATINGITVTNGSNTINTAIDNVTLNLTAPGSSTVKIWADPTATSDAVSTFVTAYNSLQSAIASLTAFDAKTNTRGLTAGESAIRNVQTTLSSAIMSVSPKNSSLWSLGQIGITTDPKTGQLNLDKTKLNQALADNPQGVTALLAGPNGLAPNVILSSTRVLADNGTINPRVLSLTYTIDDLGKQYRNIKTRIDTGMANTRRQFARLDVDAGQLKALSNMLTQEFSRMANSNKK